MREDPDTIDIRDPLERFHVMTEALLASGADEWVVNGDAGSFFKGSGGTLSAPFPFQDAGDLQDWLHELADASFIRLDARHPSAGGRWPGGGGRWHAVIAPMAADGPCFTLRRHRFDSLGTKDFPGFDRVRAIVEKAHAKGVSVLFAGPTASGKSSLLAAWLKEEASHLRVGILESIAELPLHSPEWFRLSAKPADLDGGGAILPEHALQEMLRLRPDRIVIGEIRAGEEEAFHQAAASGHGTVTATIHARTTRDLMRRFPRLILHEPLIIWLDRGGKDDPHPRVHTVDLLSPDQDLQAEGHASPDDVARCGRPIGYKIP